MVRNQHAQFFPLPFLATQPFFLLSPANVHDFPFARPLLAWAVHLYRIRPRVIRLDAAYWGLKLIAWIHATLGAVAVIRLPSQTPEKSLLSASHVDQRGVGQTQWDRTVLRSHFSFLPSATSSPLRLVYYCSASCSDLHRYHHRRAGSSTSGASRSHSLAQTCFSSYMGGFLSWEMPSDSDTQTHAEILLAISTCIFSSVSDQ